ncbi:MAG: hypothetical protein JJLCMIEE_02146 [Acidimicrobiales bacterium]|nr:hypothetical protein [Acidimicrobiales bacterium]
MLRRARLLVVSTVLALGTLSACSSGDDASPQSTPSTGASPGTATDSGTDAAGALVDVTAMGTTTGTDGRVYLADGQGRALQLRGFNIKTEDPLAEASEQLLDDGAARGFNLLRLSVYWDHLEPEEGSYDEEYLEAIATVLDRAEARGIHVILSFHQDVFGPAFGFAGIPEWATRTDGLSYTQHDVWLENYLEPAVQAAWEHLYEDEDIRQAQARTWAMIADRFGDHRAVIGYDLLNEPFGKIREGENLISAAARVQETQITAMYDRLISAMRPEDPDGWMFIQAPNVASVGLPVTLGAVDDERVVFFPHMYDAAIESATYAGGETSLDLSFFETYESVITTYPDEHGVPLMIGEWGLASPENEGMDVFVAESLALMDRVGSGWTVFNWCRGDGYCPIDENGEDRPNIGQIVQPWARAIAGSPTSWSFDRATSTFRVTFEDNDASGTTDIQLAASTAYPDGWVVTTTDAEGEWHHEYDESTGVLSVTTPDSGGQHTICVQPRSSELTCSAPQA